MGKKSGSGCGMNNPDHISEGAEKPLFEVNILKIFDADPGPGFGDGKNSDPGSEIRDGKNSDPG
jgi:hypothetical protein